MPQTRCLLFAVVLLCTVCSSLACTSLVVGKGASADGSVLLTHSNDAELNPDARLCKTPAKDHRAGSMRPVYGFEVGNYKRYIGSERGDCYLPEEGEEVSKPIGYIPQVNHTFSYYEAEYGVLNEHGVGMGESTCSSVFATKPAGSGGKALLNMETLSRICLERARTARECVQVMGSVSEKYGFYGAGTFEGSAESLLIGDPEEAFIFHISPDPTGESAIWVAQRVPDDHVGVVPNMFVIRNIDFEDSHNFLFSSSVRTVAIDKGWWKPEDGPLDFTKVYSDGEYDHKYYSGRRIWGSYRLFGIDLPDEYSDLRYEAVYPTTAKPPRKVKVEDLFRIHRDFYQGTKYDMTQGLAAGPWGDPDRYEEHPTSVKGGWERSIGIYRTSTTHVAQTRATGQGPIVWFAPHASATSVFIPLPVKGDVPKAYTVAPPTGLDRSSAYSVHRMVANMAKLKYNYSMVDIRQAQSAFEEAGLELVRRLDATNDADASTLDQAYSSHAARVVEKFSTLPMELLVKFADGNLNNVPYSGYENGRQQYLGYPDWWLKAVGYQQGPPPPPMECGPHKCSSGAPDDQLMNLWVPLVLLCCLAVAAVIGLKLCVGKKRMQHDESLYFTLCGEHTSEAAPDLEANKRLKLTSPASPTLSAASTRFSPRSRLDSNDRWSPRTRLDSTDTERLSF